MTKALGKRRSPGNPEFGVKYKATLQGEEARDRIIAIRFTPTEEAKIKELLGDNFRNICRDLILQELEKRNVG